MRTCIVVLLFSVSVVALTGCGASSSMSSLNEGVTAGQPTLPDSVKIYAARDIGRLYVELGSVSASIHDELDGKKYVKKIKEEAAKIGADAIVAFQQLGSSAVGIAVKYKQQ